MANIPYEKDILLSITMQYKDICLKIMRDKNMLGNDGKYKATDLVYVMSHMEKAYNKFDNAMEEVYQYMMKDPNNMSKPH